MQAFAPPCKQQDVSGPPKVQGTTTQVPARQTPGNEGWLSPKSSSPPAKKSQDNTEPKKSITSPEQPAAYDDEALEREFFKESIAFYHYYFKRQQAATRLRSSFCSLGPGPSAFLID